MDSAEIGLLILSTKAIFILRGGLEKFIRHFHENADSNVVAARVTAVTMRGNRNMRTNHGTAVPRAATFHHPWQSPLGRQRSRDRLSHSPQDLSFGQP